MTTLAGVEARAATGPTRGSRVVMYVLNDCRTDVRVLREAKTLADAGFDATHLGGDVDQLLVELGAVLSDRRDIGL